MYPPKYEVSYYKESIKEAFSDYVPALPRHVSIEISTVCNMDCVYCCRKLNGSNAVTGEGFMNDAVFELAKEAVKEARAILVCGMGEQTLHPKCGQWMKELRQIAPSANIRIVSNGKRLLTHEFIEFLAKADINVSFSFDSCVKEVYERVRRGGDYDRVVGNLQRIQEYKLKHNSVLPHVGIGAVLTEDSAPYLVDTFRFVAKYGISTFFYTGVTEVGTPPSFFRDRKRITIDDEICRAMKEESKRLDIQVENRRDLHAHFAEHPCADPKMNLMITRHGFLSVCGRGSSIFGHVGEGTFDWLWNVKRRAFVEKPLFSAICRQCKEKQTWFVCV